MRMVLACPFSFTPASRIFEMVDQQPCQALADLGRGAGDAEIARLRDAQTGVAARVDGAKGREVQVDVQGEPMVRPAAGYTYAERRHLGTVHIDPRGPRPALRARSEKVDHALLEQAYERLDLDAASSEIDQRIEHYLPGAVIGHLAAAVCRQHRNAVGHLDRYRALAERVDRRVLEQPELVRRAPGPLGGEAAHRVERGQVRHLPEALDHEIGDHRHSTITTAGWSHSSW